MGSLYTLNEARSDMGILAGRERGMYAPLVKRCPIRVDDEVPERVKGLLRAHGTCACTDSDIVYVDTSLADDMFLKASEVSGRNSKVVEPWMARENYRTLLVHEYTHIIMQHVKKGTKFIRANGDKNYPIFALACDIEANRGYGIVKDSDLYQIAVTDDYYPECKGVEGLMNIYRVLKKNYGDEILDNYNKAKDEPEGGDADEDEDGAETESPDGTAEAEGEGGDGKSKQRGEALKRAVPSMEQMRDEIEQQASMMTEDELDEDIEQFDEEHAEVVAGSGDEEGEENGSPYAVLKAQYNKYLEQEAEKVIEKLRGLVRGSQIKTRVGTYSRQSRREGADGLIRKGVKNKKALAPRILVAMDSSGSMYSTNVTPIATAIGTIAKTLGKTKGSYICEHESHVKNVKPLSKWEEVVKLYYPDGDNDFDEVLEKAIELNVEVVLNVGDGYANLWDMATMKRAKDKGIKWLDVQVAGMEEKLKEIIDNDASRHGKNFIGREIIKVNKG